VKKYEMQFKEIEALIFNEFDSKNKADTDKKDSSRKNTSRKEHTKSVPMNQQMSPAKTKSSGKSKTMFDFDNELVPECTYDITQDRMTILITRAASFTKKQMQKLEKLVEVPERSPNADL